MKKSESTQNRIREILEKLPRHLRLHWQDSYDLLTQEAGVSEDEAIDFANGKVRSIRSVEREWVHS
jgi:hypothetical protein